MSEAQPHFTSPKHGPSKPPPRKARAPRVMIVDDDVEIRETLFELLTDEGYEVECAPNGQVALDSLVDDDFENPPRLVLLDLMMPVMSGWELLETMQEDERLAKIPVVVVSAMTAPGVEGHLQKPVDLDRLLSTVARFCRSKRAR